MFNTAKLLDSYRDASEDRAEFMQRSEDTLVMIVADGVGGRENGGEAATHAVKRIRELAGAAGPRELSDERFWKGAFGVADYAVSDDPGCGETTLVAVCLTPTRIVGASVGDSEAWWIDGAGAIRVLTEGGRKPYLGRGMAIPVSFSLPVPRTGTLLVATDGLFKYADADRIGRTVAANSADLPAAAHALRDLVRSSSGTFYDDFAVLLVMPD